VQQYPGLTWPPEIGDRVNITGTGLGGIVMHIEGEGDGRRYILDVYPHAAMSGLHAPRNDEDADAARTTYALHELEPAC
jgi:hypothetical protein